jgi:hypothetical protein
MAKKIDDSAKWERVKRLTYERVGYPHNKDWTHNMCHIEDHPELYPDIYYPEGFNPTGVGCERFDMRIQAALCHLAPSLHQGIPTPLAST